MIKLIAPCALLLFALLPPASAADPIKLKMAYFSSDRTTTYLAAIAPFVDAVNAEAAGLLQIDVSVSGALGKNPAQQLQLVLDGTADLAFVSPVIRQSDFRTTPSSSCPDCSKIFARQPSPIPD
ncbi:MAG: hypothetical protein WAV27_26335 [Xanthobacteraceae bacterium]